ncbi:unnamed protein product [Parnassius apollo]|uniref:(apollo) hypothetical protein n=1 Tax=Parnassius apollo TaxID=110799 RepID=A0A8S3XED3_PARAO|nr:unnamed protein product [Parnassius apollo]
MEIQKAVGPDEVPIEAWKALGTRGVCILTNHYNGILSKRIKPDQWRLSIITSVYKGRGSVHDCGNYRGIKVTSHTMKPFERIIDTSIRQECTLSDSQYGFQPGRVTMDPIFALRIPMEKTAVGDTSSFPITLGEHQGSVLSPYLFSVILDELSPCVQKLPQPWLLMYADDIALVDGDKGRLTIRVHAWREVLENGGLKLNVAKTEYMTCNSTDLTSLRIGDDTVERTDNFRYLGPVLDASGGHRSRYQGPYISGLSEMARGDGCHL